MRGTTVTIIIIIFLIIIGAVYAFNVDRPELPGETNSSMLSTTTGMAIAENNVQYFENATGFYVRPQTAGDYPGVIMIHEWWGLNDNIRDTARQLAGQGYAVLAVDLFGRVATTTEQAQRQTSSLDQARALANLRAAKNYLEDRGSERIASLGWCFGGGQSLQLSVSGEDLDATVVYYGNLITDQNRLSNIEWPVLGIFGDADTSIPTTTVRQFETALNSLDIENSIYIYPGVGHAFANPSGMNYAPAETRDAWDKTLSFLDRNLRGD